MPTSERVRRREQSLRLADRGQLGSDVAGRIAEAITLIEGRRPARAALTLRELLRTYGYPDPAPARPDDQARHEARQG